VIQLVKLQYFTATESASNVAHNNDMMTQSPSAQVHRGLEINSSRDDIIFVLIVGYVCYSTITGGSSQHSAVALFDL